MPFKNLFKQSHPSEDSTKKESTIENILAKTIAPPESTPEEDERKDPGKTSVDDLFPFGTRTYEAVAPDTDAPYLCDHASICPVCGQHITLPKPLTAALSLVHVDNDLRRHYKEFSPLWYDIWYCPHCYYTALYTDFEESRNFYAQNIKQAMLPYQQAGILSFSTPRTVDETITSMYMALRCADFYDCEPLAIAKIWLHLSWIYHDLEDEDMFMKASAKALEAYKRMYYEHKEDFPPVVEQTCFLVTAELYILQKDYENAYTCLVHSKRVEGGNRLYIMNAQNRIDDVKEMRQAEKEKMQS
ncbi:MAG: DUF2225 domain-containing protein [Lachnospiraceae bacterium]